MQGKNVNEVVLGYAKTKQQGVAPNQTQDQRGK